MNLEKLYQEMGGDMADAVRRLGSASAVERFLRMFAGDDTFAMLQAAMSAGDVQRAFRAAHTLKGLAANLGLVQLGQAASALTEALRGSDMQRASALYPETAAAYRGMHFKGAYIAAGFLFALPGRAHIAVRVAEV